MNVAQGGLRILDDYGDYFAEWPILSPFFDGTAAAAESLGGWYHRKDFEDVQTFCLFIGHARSGHTLVGSLLDAHPEMIIAHELDALDQVRRGTSRERLFYRLLIHSRWFADRGARWGPYDYDVPGQYKGEFTKLKVIGDKRGNGTTLLLRQDPGLLHALKRTVNVPLRLIHVVRHPLDNISTLARKGDMELGGDGDIDAAIETYFRQCETLKRVKDQVSDMDWVDWFQCSHEGFIRSTKKSLRRICQFLGVSCTEGYLNDCEGIVFDSPSHSRKKISYTSEQLVNINERMSCFPRLFQYYNTFS